MKKLVVPLFVFAAVMLGTYLVKNRSHGDAPVGGDAVVRPHVDQLYVEVSAIGNIDYFYDHKLGMKMAEKYLGVQTRYIGPAEYDMDAMVTAFEQVLNEPNLKGVVVVGFEDVLIPTINKAIDRGIPVVTVDADLPKSKRIAFVGTGNYQAGLRGGEKLAELVGGKGKVAFMTKPGQSNLEERIRGYKAALSGFPDIKVVQIADTRSDPNVAAQAAGAILERHPDLAGIACVESAGGVGAATAVRERKLTGTVKIVAMDRGNDILGLIRDDVIHATIAQQTALMPFYAVQILYNYQNSPVPVAEDNVRAGITGVPLSVDTGVIVVDKTNCSLFIRE